MSEPSPDQTRESPWVRDGRLDADALVPALESFLAELLRAARLELRASVQVVPGADSVEIEVQLDGRDAELLLARRGELLLALEHIALRWLRLEAQHRDHIRFDCQGYRASRIAELKLAAETAATRVRQSRTPFRFQPMDARERRIVHLALKDFPGVRTSSEGEGEQRAVVVFPA